MKELLDLIRDTIVVNPKNLVIEPQLPAELESQGLYIMLTEEARRDRQRRFDLGDKTAALNVQQAAGTAAAMLMATTGGASTPKFPAAAAAAAATATGPSAMSVAMGAMRPPMQAGGAPHLSQMPGAMRPQQG